MIIVSMCPSTPFRYDKLAKVQVDGNLPHAARPLYPAAPMEESCLSASLEVSE